MAHGYQFVHLEAYSRKPDRGGRSVGWVLSEAAREPGASPHVPQPAPPEIVFGVGLDEVRRRHDEACDVAKVVLANGKQRAVRKDQKSLLTIVASHPATMDSFRSDAALAADVSAWEQRTVDWLRAQYGDALLSIARHTDESHPHLHAYILPDDLRAARLHPGVEAKHAVTSAGPVDGEDAKTLNRRGDAAYKRAMREWQDSYHRHVGVPSGLARLGPGRRRLSRDKWQAERSAAAATKSAIDRATQVNARLREHVASVKSAAVATIALARERTAAAEAREQQAAVAVAVAQEQVSVAATAATEAKALQAAAEARERQAAATLARAGREAERIVASARGKASRISSWGSRFRAFFDGLRKSSILEAARRAAAQTFERERARADDATRRALEESQRRQEAERLARAATDSVRVTARERDSARQELAALRPERTAPAACRRMGR